MKKRLLALLLSVALISSSVSADVLAAEVTSETEETDETDDSSVEEIEAIDFRDESLKMWVGSPQQISVCAYPYGVLVNGSFEYASSNTEVATVSKLEDSIDEVLVTPVGIGETVITATFTEAGTGKVLTSECKVKVSDYCSDEMYTNALSALDSKLNEKEIIVLTNILEKKELSEIALPEGWEWVDPTEKLEGEDGSEVQYFDAQYTESKKYDSPIITKVPVTVSTITGLKLTTSNNAMTSGGENWVQLDIQYKGFEPWYGYFNQNDLFKNAVTVSYDNKQSDKITAEFNEESKLWFTIKADNVEADTNQNVGVSIHVGQDTFSATVPVKVKANPYVTNICLDRADDPSEENNNKYFDEESGNYNFNFDYKDIDKKGLDIPLVAYLDTTDDKPASCKVTWKSSDTGIANVYGMKVVDGVATANVKIPKKMGVSVVTVTAQDDGKCMAKAIINVRDFTPVLGNTSIVANYNLVQGTMLELAVPDATTINNIFIKEENVSTNYSFTFDNEKKEYYLYPNQDGLKGNAKATIVVEYTISGEEDEIKQVKFPVNIKNQNTVPAVTFKQTSGKANLLFKDECQAKFEVKTSGVITKMENAASIDEKFVGFKLDDTDWFDEVYFSAVGLNEETLKDFTAKKSELLKVPVRVTFDGYKPVVTTVTVQAALTMPKLYCGEAVFYGSNDTVAVEPGYSWSNSKYRYVFGNSDVKSVTTGVEATPNYGVDESDGYKWINNVSLKRTNPKLKSCKLEIKPTEWTKAALVNVKLSSAKTRTVELSSQKLIINRKINASNNPLVTSLVSFKGSSEEIQEIIVEVDKKDKKTQAALDCGGLIVWHDECSVMVSLDKKLGQNVKAGTYSVLVSAKANDGTVTKAKKLVIVVEDKAPVLKLKTSGTINLANNKSFEKLVPSVSNVTAEVENIELTGENAKYFYLVSEEDGSFKLCVDSRYNMVAKSYEIEVVAQLDNALKVSSKLNVKTVCKLPAIDQSAKSITLYRNDIYRYKYITHSIKDGSTSIAKISVPKQKGIENFDVSVEWYQGKLMVSLNDNGKKLKAGSYKIKYYLWVDGQARGSKGVEKTLTVVVK